ncbi:thioesterase II family protein [Lentibacillus cibarius]|uniref:thioesterase II family protein n=1 Tax=Lentibacillus cibarius TaxID=2583219 RepID=UPI001486B866|nr:thioesterase [Lentibacillus cibarius]
MEKKIKDFVELYPIELAGRGSRANEPLYQTFEEAVDDLYGIITENLDNYTPYAFFGHSMGGMMAYELSHRMQCMGMKSPVHIYFSGVNAPLTATKKNDKKINSKWTDEKLFKLGGIPKELLQRRELLNLFLPVLRSDLLMSENFDYSKYNAKLDTDISIFHGDQDELVTNNLEKWRSITSKTCTIHTFSGGHFFIKQHVNTIVEIINQMLEPKASIDSSYGPMV